MHHYCSWQYHYNSASSSLETAEGPLKLILAVCKMCPPSSDVDSCGHQGLDTVSVAGSNACSRDKKMYGYAYTHTHDLLYNDNNSSNYEITLWNSEHNYILQ